MGVPDMARPRVFITGSGAVCGSGKSPAEIFDALCEGRSSIAPIRQWDTTGWPVNVAAEIPDFDARAMVDDRKLHKFIRRTDFFGIYDDGTRRIRYVNCAHVSPLLLRASGELVKLDSTATMLGAFQMWKCREAQADLGELIVVHN